MGTSEKPQTEALDLKVELVVFGDGERCPMLVDKASGVPLYNPTVWTLSR